MALLSKGKKVKPVIIPKPENKNLLFMSKREAVELSNRIKEEDAKVAAYRQSLREDAPKEEEDTEETSDSVGELKKPVRHKK